MPLDAPYFIAVIVGLFSSLHCLGMCGSIMGALSLSLPVNVRSHPVHLSRYVVAYNAGRLLTYVLMGLLVGLAGKLADGGLGADRWHHVANLIAALTLVLIGLYLTGWLPALRRLDLLGSPIWRWLDPLRRRLLPISTVPHALVAGMLWGWVPCGLVYYALFLALPLDGPLQSALFMLLFGLGTLPSMGATGIFTGWLAHLGRNPRLRQAAGLFIVALGLAGLWFGFGISDELLPQAS